MPQPVSIDLCKAHELQPTRHPSVADIQSTVMRLLVPKSKTWEEEPDLLRNVGFVSKLQLNKLSEIVAVLAV